MTKEQEISILSETITRLGSDSYLGEWFALIKNEVERDVRNDIFPSITISDYLVKTKADCYNLRYEAEIILKNAKVKAQTEEEALQKKLSEQIHSARVALERALREVNRY